jgi:hypothetical protein
MQGAGEKAGIWRAGDAWTSNGKIWGNPIDKDKISNRVDIFNRML